MISRIHPYNEVKSTGCFRENIKKNPKNIRMILSMSLKSS